MTGIDRLRTLAGEWDAYGLGGALGDVARQIERERACDADTIENVRLIVGGVSDEMERHILGHEGMEDSPVARWARELREALGGEEHDPSKDVSMSAYDLLTADERDAIAWVRDHGGLEKIIQQRRDSVPRAAYERKLDKRLRHIAECEEALRRRNATISSLEKAADRSRKQIADMRPRLMPEGMEWPRYEDGEPVRIGDEYECWCGETHRLNSVTIKKYNSIINLTEPHPFVVSDGPFTSHGKLVKRPTPKVLDADGAEIRVGDTVWHTRTRDEYSVIGVPSKSVINVSKQLDGREIHGVVSPYSLTHRAPVLAADGKQLREEEMVYEVDGTGHAYKVASIRIGNGNPLTPTVVTCDEGDGTNEHFLPSALTHERPESKCRDCKYWQKDPTADNMGVCWFYYHEHEGQDCYAARRGDIGACEEFMPRGKELAGDA